MLAFLLACASPTPAPSEPEPGESCPADVATVTAEGAPRTVVLISIDTVNRAFLGIHHPTWDTTPTIDALLAEGVRFDNVLVPRGLSAVSMASMVTGAYPVTHEVRDNELPEEGVSGISADVPTLFHRFADAGYDTYGWLANMCFLLDGDTPIAHRSCQSDDENPGTDQAQGDARLATEAAEALAALPADQNVFAWIHLMDPHDPYDRRDPWYTEFHPEAYDGPLQDPTEADLLGISRGDTPYTEEDRLQLEAIYASQVRQSDENVKTILEGLEAAGRLDDAVIVFAIDHGDELARRTGYFFHGCSPYNGVIGVTWGIRAPGRVAAGEVLDHWVPSIDIAPTVVELAGLDWSGPGEGRSLVPQIRSCTESQHPAFFERGSETVGVVLGKYKYILDPRAGYAKCKHYDGENPFPGEPEELYDLDADPGELTNLVEEEPAPAQVLHREVCAWVGSYAWSDDAENAVVKACGT